jgi:uncharacterized membrane protein
MSTVETFDEESWGRQAWPERERAAFAAPRKGDYVVGLAQALGWFSLGLGLAELAVPGRLSRLIGVRKGTTLLLQALGAREIASGVGILTGRRTPRWVWSRVAGDLVDLALLGAALGDRRSTRSRVAAATAAVAGVTALDVVTAKRLARRRNGRPGLAADGSLRVQRTIAINCAPADAYALWRDLEGLPRFMEHLRSVEAKADGRSHWVARAPAGASVEWDAEIVEDRAGEAISWRSLEGAEVENRGSVRFEAGPGGRGTMVRVDLEYRPPAGALASAVAKLFGEEPEQQIQADLRRFKQFLEAGEVPTTEGQPAGPRSLMGRALASGRE